MPQPGIELVRDLIARFFNGRNPDLAPEFFAPDFRWHGGSAGTHGLGAYIASVLQFFAALPDAEAIEQDTAQDGDTVIMIYHLSNGVIAEQWASEDRIAFLQAIGGFTHTPVG